MKRTNRISKKIKNSIIAAVVLLFLIIAARELFWTSTGVLNLFFKDKCAPIEQNLKNTCRVNDSTYTVIAGQLTDMDFDELYIISGQRFPDEVEKIIGTKYDDVLPEDAIQFIFLRNKKIINQFNSAKCSINLTFTMDRYKGYLKINRTSKLYIKRREFPNNPQNPKEGSYFSYTVSVAEQQ